MELETNDGSINEMEDSSSTVDTNITADENDSKSWTQGLVESLVGHSSKREATMPVDRDAHEYNMKHKERGKAIIFNHKTFLQAGLSPRNGTDADRDNLEKCLQSLGFDVKVYNDAKQYEVQEKIRMLAREDHSNRDCVLVAVFSHGDKSRLHAKDDDYKPDLLWEPFAANECPTLAGKPKIFLIQACQGDQVDSGTVLKLKSRTATDSAATVQKQYTVPNKADFVTVYSTVPGFYSWRNTTDGSWFIQSVCRVLREYAEEKDFLSMLTIIARCVALDYESYVPGNPDMDRKKQIPLITSTLTRDIYFR